MHRTGYSYGSYEGAIGINRASGVLKTLDAADTSIPNDILTQYLTANYGHRLKVDPRKFEELVGDVFSDFGYDVVVTQYSGDQGIDVAILNGDGDWIVGVQVKREKGNISCGHIHALEGALRRKNLTKGIFITTSHFQPSAVEASDDFRRQGIAIELWDADEFYSRL